MQKKAHKIAGLVVEALTGQTPMAFGGWLVEDDCGAGSVFFIEFKVALVGEKP